MQGKNPRPGRSVARIQGAPEKNRMGKIWWAGPGSLVALKARVKSVDSC